MDINMIFEDVGEFGWYQLIVSLLLSACMIPANVSYLNVVFIMGVSDFWCDIPELQSLNYTKEQAKNLSIPFEDNLSSKSYSQCMMYDRNYTGINIGSHGSLDNTSITKCKNGWNYETDTYGETATTKWDLVCDNKWWKSAAASFFSFGLLTALLLYGTLSDMYGRKPALCASTVLFILSNLATALSPNYIFLTVTRFFCGVFASPFFGGTFVLCAEIIGPTWRAHVIGWYGYFWVGGGLLLAGLAYVIRNWRTLQFTLTALMTIFLVYFWLPESPRWLHLKGRDDDAHKIFERIAKSNKKKYIPQQLQEKIPEEKAFLWHLFRTKSYAIRTFVVVWNWFTVSTCYFGLIFMSTNLGSDPYISFVILILLQAAGFSLCHLCVVKIGRKWPLVICMILSATSLLLTLLFEKGSVILLVLVSFGKMLCACAFNLMWLYTVELYPTVIRGQAASVGNFAGRLGSIIAPFLAQLSEYGSSIPMIIFGVGPLSAGLLAMCLPETIGIPLEDRLHTVDINILPKPEPAQSTSDQDLQNINHSLEKVVEDEERRDNNVQQITTHM